MADRRADTVRSPLDRAVERGGLALSRARAEGGAAGRNRLRQLEITVVISVQAGLAAALAALLADELLGSGAHVFAPAAAVGTIATAIGQRARRTFELLIGVGLGILVGDLLRALLGSGSWQTGLVVTLAIATALLVAGRGGALVGQAGGTAVLIATLAPVQPGLELPRIFDALVGGLVGLFVVALLLPVNPIRVLDRAVEPVVARLTERLDAVAHALTRRDADAAQRALEDLRGIEPDIGRLNDALSGAEEVVTIAPARWHRRAQFHRYAEATRHLERLVLYARSIARRSATALQYDEPVPPALPDAVARLGQAVREMKRACKSGADLESTRELVRSGAELAGRAWSQGVRAFGEAMISDLRTAQSELLRATGCRPEDANGSVRRAAGAGESEARPPARARMSRPVPRRSGVRHRPKATGRQLAPARAGPAG
ncbi:FUSC family protein [Micromonospora sp. ANENR4]|uniref:FUSC family protein n=1 Tax=unclassified Micromonospora TaxID=2617518 RepID=UPI00188E89F1|nr:MULTISPECIES: FUSC family protein [unclassified Micromonospora]MBF5029230.1 FUSC family protein [Micromonospora sp. ANENR4]MCZ7475639.1 FUSC family protein [Micromonospora sp. WMMC273]